MMDQHINISLRLQDRVADIRIPRRIEVRRLIRELSRIFDLADGHRKYQLHVRNKGLFLHEGRLLADYPITTGDIVEIEEKTVD